MIFLGKSDSISFPLTQRNYNLLFIVAILYDLCILTENIKRYRENMKTIFLDA